jgi:hypothetical protein
MRSAQRPAPRAFLRHLGGVHRVEAGLGARESKPGEGVEVVVPVVGARLHLAGLVDLDLVIGVLLAGRHEADRLAALRPHPVVQTFERALAEPGAHGVENRMR